MKHSVLTLLIGLGLWACMILQPLTGVAQGTGFTYQGRLNNTGQPVEGSHDLRFTIFDAATQGRIVGNVVTIPAVPVVNGLFAVDVDPGPGVFTGAERWLEIAVRPRGVGAFSTLLPRERITAAPYAITAGTLTGILSSNNIGPGSITTAMLAPGSVGSNQLAGGAVGTAALARGAVTADRMAGVTNWAALTIPNPSAQPAASDGFGQTMAIVGSDRLIIGAPEDASGGFRAGAVHVFTTGGTWLLSLPPGEPEDRFGAAVAGLGGDRLIVGAPSALSRFVRGGAAYVYRTNGTFAASLSNPQEVSGDNFGAEVAALDEGRVLVGAPGKTIGGVRAGAVYVFRSTGGLLHTITNPVTGDNDSFGAAVAGIGGNRVLVGAPFADRGTSSVGVAYLFTTNGTLLTTFTNPVPAASSAFGSGVAAMDAQRVLIGAAGSRAAYVYNTNGTLLTTVTGVFGSVLVPAGNDRFYVNVPGPTVQLWSGSGALLNTLNRPSPTSGTSFGSAVAVLEDGRVVVGAPRDGVGGVNSGVAYLFEPETYVPGLVADGVRTRAVTTASLQDGAVTAAKIGGVLAPGQIPELSANRIASGQLDDARLSANVALRNRNRQNFSGTNSFTQAVGIGTTSPETDLHIQRGSAGSVVANTTAPVVMESDTNCFLQLLTPAAAFSGILFGSPVNTIDASIRYNFNGTRELAFRSGGNTTRMVIMTNGFVGIGDTSPDTFLEVVNATCDGSSWINASDRALKEDFAPVDPQEVLARVAALPVQRWRYKAQPGQTHIGPVAQDFHAAFGLGGGDTSIATVDADGVALAAIQGLNQKLERAARTAETEIAALRGENAALKERLEKLERLLQAGNRASP